MSLCFRILPFFRDIEDIMVGMIKIAALGCVGVLMMIRWRHGDACRAPKCLHAPEMTLDKNGE